VTTTARTGRGYLTSALNPNWSGLTKITFRDTARIEPNTQYTVCYVESGFGMRNLIAAIGVDGKLVQSSAEIEVEYAIDGFGLLSKITIDSEDGE
jgi:hypothetical protein